MILDTSVLVAVLYGEPESDRYIRLIHAAERCLISAGSFLELSIVIERQTGPEVARQCDGSQVTQLYSGSGAAHVGERRIPKCEVLEVGV